MIFPWCNGRNFVQTDYNPDYNKLSNIIISETAVKGLGFSSGDEALGKNLSIWNKNWTVIGIIRDFHQKSLHYSIEPVVLMPFFGTDHPISVKVTANDLAATIQAIK